MFVYIGVFLCNVGVLVRCCLFLAVVCPSIFVSVCRWCVLVSSVHPVIILSAEFRIVCSLFVRVCV